MVAGLTRRFGDLDLAEEMTAEAFAVAVERWPTDGAPANPGGWIRLFLNLGVAGEVLRRGEVRVVYQVRTVDHGADAVPARRQGEELHVAVQCRIDADRHNRAARAAAPVRPAPGPVYW